MTVCQTDCLAINKPDCGAPLGLDSCKGYKANEPAMR